MVLSPCLLDESLLQFADFALESFNFLPAVERSSVVVAQTLHQAFLGLFNLYWHLLDLFALLQLLAQVHDLLADAVVGSVGLVRVRLRVLLGPVVVKGRAEVRDQSSWLTRQFGRRVVGGEGSAEGVECLGLRVAHLLEVGGDACLHLQLVLLCARRVGL